MPGGRPTKYRKEYADEARRLCLLLNATDEQLAAYFGVTEKTIYNWSDSHPEFLQARKEGKIGADCQVARSLYERAIGGDTTAMIFWLKNRQSHAWRDKQDVDHSHQGAVEIKVVREFVEPTAQNRVAEHLSQNGNGAHP